MLTFIGSRFDVAYVHICIQATFNTSVHKVKVISSSTTAHKVQVMFSLQ